MKTVCAYAQEGLVACARGQQHLIPWPIEQQAHHTDRADGWLRAGWCLLALQVHATQAEACSKE